MHELERQKETNTVMKATEYVVLGQALYITIYFNFILVLFLIEDYNLSWEAVLKIENNVLKHSTLTQHAYCQWQL